MRLLIDAVGIAHYSNCISIAYAIGKIVYEKVGRGLDIILITDEKDGDRYIGKVAQCLRQTSLRVSYTEKIGETKCPYTCICDDKHPKCGKVKEHEVYAAPCRCDDDDWLLMAKCCCGHFRQGVCADFSNPPGCRRLDGESVEGCFLLFKCPRD